MNQSFLLWYYTAGVKSAVGIAVTFLRFTLRKWNTLGLLATLFSPWKRDISPKNWLGFNPVKMIGLGFNNFLSRFLGMIVRSFVIAFGLFIFVFVFILACLILLSYLTAPFLLVIGIALTLFVSPGFGVFVVLLSILGFGAGMLAYTGRQKPEPYLELPLLQNEPWFPRVLARLGLEKKNISEELLSSQGAFLQYLGTLGIEPKTFERAILIERFAFEKRAKQKQFWLWENLVKKPIIGRGWKYAYTPHLDRYSVDLSLGDSSEYRNLDLVGRAEELKVATVILERPTQNSIVLVGEPGIGKQTFIHYLARLIRENAFSGTFYDDARVLVFDMGMAVSDATNQSEDIDGYMRLLFHEAMYAGNVILVIQNMDRFLGNDPSAHNFAPLMSEYLQSPTFRVIATASAENYHLLAKHDEQALKFFEPIYVRETTEDETLLILLQNFEELEKSQVVFSMQALESIISGSAKYNWSNPFPERSLDLAQEVLTYWRTSGTGLISPETVNAFITLKTGVPVGALGEGEKEKLLQLEELLHRRVIGQDEAITQVAEAMRKARAGFGDEKRPLGSFIFLGPTGVGKTETVKAFAESYFGSEESMIRLDMSEFQTPEAVDRLIGSREMNMQGQLTNIAREKPFSILLLDEVEKGYPKALDLFLQILDEGFVTDGFGEKVSFRNMIIIATSNAGASLIKSLVEQGAPLETIRKSVLDHIVENNIFRLEFLNRFDGLIFFEPLKSNELLEVVNLKLQSFADRLKKEKNISISFTPDVAVKIVEKGYQPEFGARSINRYMDDTIEDVVVKKIISGEAVSGTVLSFSADDLV
ncbi:MAG: AAA family ATPase [Patescibacteria group bacterium]